MSKKNSTSGTGNKGTTFAQDPKGPKPDSLNVAAASAAEAEAGTKKAGYKTMVVGVSKANDDKHAALEALAKKLGCKPSALVWEAVERLLKSPPTVAPAGAAPSTGTASGFWVLPVKGKDGRATGAEVREVASRGDVDGGSTFFRFKVGDDKERNRAKQQAIRGAKYVMDLLGAAGEPKVKELDAAAK